MLEGGSKITIGHFTVMDGSEGDGDLVLTQTFFALLWKLFLKNTRKHKNKLIYMIKQEGLYQSKVTLSVASIHNCKMAYYAFDHKSRACLPQFINIECFKIFAKYV